MKTKITTWLGRKMKTTIGTKDTTMSSRTMKMTTTRVKKLKLDGSQNGTCTTTMTKMKTKTTAKRIPGSIRRQLLSRFYDSSKRDRHGLYNYRAQELTENEYDIVKFLFKPIEIEMAVIPTQTPVITYIESFEEEDDIDDYLDNPYYAAGIRCYCCY